MKSALKSSIETQHADMHTRLASPQLDGGATLSLVLATLGLAALVAWLLGRGKKGGRR